MVSACLHPAPARGRRAEDACAKSRGGDKSKDRSDLAEPRIVGGGDDTEEQTRGSGLRVPAGHWVGGSWQSSPAAWDLRGPEQALTSAPASPPAVRGVTWTSDVWGPPGR